MAAEALGGVGALEAFLAGDLEETPAQPTVTPAPPRRKNGLTREQAEAMSKGLDGYDSRIKGGRLVG